MRIIPVIEEFIELFINTWCITFLLAFCCPFYIAVPKAAKSANNKEAISKLGVGKSSGYQGYECQHEGFSKFLAQGDSKWFMTSCELAVLIKTPSSLFINSNVSIFKRLLNLDIEYNYS